MLERVVAIAQQDVDVLIEFWQSGWRWYGPRITAFVLEH